MSQQIYVENCIFRIITAPCEPRNEKLRAQDLAGCVKAAAASGFDAAHRLLIDLVHDAEQGRYKPQEGDDR